LFVGLIINPALTSKFMKLEERPINVRRRLRNNLIILAVGLVVGYVLNIRWLGNLLIICSLMVLIYIYLLVPAIKRFQTSFLPRLENAYEKLLRFALRGKNANRFFIGSFLLLIFSFMLTGI